VVTSASTPSGGAALSTAPRGARSGGKSGVVIGAIAAAVVIGGGAVALTMRGGDDGATPSPTAAPTATATATATASAAPLVEWDGPCPKGMKPVVGGSFSMGSDDPSFPPWKPAHKVTVDSFCLDVLEVTIADYAGCVDRGSCKPPDTTPSFPKAASATDEEHAAQLKSFAELCNWEKDGRKSHPVNCLDWFRAETYCKAKQQRLPTEAEWELAARGTDGRKFPWGNDAGNETYMNAGGLEWKKWLVDHGMPAPANLMYQAEDGYAGTAPVGKFPRAMTQSGHLDMVGNVWEWTSDWFETYKDEAQVNPKGPAIGDRKAIRGGGFNGEIQTWVNPAARYHQLATASVHAIGFRCAANPKPASE
jgi:formylglycine-generating enzyme required for sulfatase activity